MRWLHRLTLWGGIVLLAWLIWKLGPATLFSKLRLLTWAWIPLLALEGMGEALHVMGWRYCLSPEHQRLPWIRIAMIRQAGMAFNYLTPTAHLGGEFIKGTLLGRHGNWSHAAASVITGKLALVLSQLNFVVTGSVIALWDADVPQKLWIAWAASTALVSSGVCIFFLLQRRGKLGTLIRSLTRRQFGKSILGDLADWLTEVDQILLLFHRERRWDLLRAMAFHLLGFSCGVLQAWIFFVCMNFPDPLRLGMTIWFMGAWFDLVGFIVPAGVGVQEGARVFIFYALGLPTVAGLTLGLVIRILKTFWAMVGLGCYGLLADRKHTVRMKLRSKA